MRRQAVPVLTLAGISTRAWGALSMVVAFACVDASGIHMSSPQTQHEPLRNKTTKGRPPICALRRAEMNLFTAMLTAMALLASAPTQAPDVGTAK
jgi:hypothetical protein